jgi:undecaprenyl-diphosphooligosaccharide--protein glycosyltransferase
MTNSGTPSSKLWIAGLLALSLIIAIAPRIDEYRDWQDDRAEYFAGDVATSNPDAYYYFRNARDVYAGLWDAESRDMLRHHPDGVARGSAPPLSRAIAFLARFTDGDVYQAGLWFSILSSCLFTIPLILYGLFVGWPAAGMLGGLFGIASGALISRTALSRVEPDGANLFALCGISLLFALLRPQSSPLRQIAVAAAAGISVALFATWYQKPALHLFLALCFVASTLVRRFPPRRLALVVAVFLLASNPLTLGDSARALFRYVEIYAALTFAPSAAVTETEDGSEALDETGAPAWSPLEFSSFSVQEQDRLALGKSLQLMLRPAWLAALGLLAFAGWAIYYWRIAAPLIPLILLGAMGLVTSKRFIMFLAPFPGFGLGVLVTLAARASLRRTRLAGHADVVSCALALGLFASFASSTAYNTRSASQFSTEMLSALQQCAEDLPTGAVVWHSWGHGYIVQDVMGAATYTDGGVPHPVIDHLLVKALSGSEPHVLQRTIAHLDSHPQEEVAAAFVADYESAYARMLAATDEITSPSYVLFTAISMAQLRSHARRGQWNPRTGRPGDLAYFQLRCLPAKGKTLECTNGANRSFFFDRIRGLFVSGAGQVQLERLVRVREGSVEAYRQFSPSGDLIVEMMVPPDPEGLTVYAMERAGFISLVNRLYVLGRADSSYLELVCDEFPHARMYRIKNDEGASSPANDL